MNAFRVAGPVLVISITVAAAAGDKEVTVTGREFAFDPTRIELTKGDQLVLTFKNEGRLSHNLTFPSLDAGMETIQSGGTVTVTLTPGDAGTYEFICTVPGHANQGMQGKLVVAE